MNDTIQALEDMQTRSSIRPVLHSDRVGCPLCNRSDVECIRHNTGTVPHRSYAPNSVVLWFASCFMAGLGCILLIDSLVRWWATR
jgi:hypothetical protein